MRSGPVATVTSLHTPVEQNWSLSCGAIYSFLLEVIIFNN